MIGYVLRFDNVLLKIKELIDFSYGSPGRYIINLQYWLSISSPLRQKLEIQLSNQIELLQLHHQHYMHHQMC